MAPVSCWLLQLDIRPDVPALGRHHLGRFRPSPLGHLVREAWLHLPVLHGVGIDLWRFDPARFSGIVHAPAGLSGRRALLQTLERQVLLGWSTVRSGAAPRRPWCPETPWTPIRTPDELAGWRRWLRTAPPQAGLRRTA